MAFDFIEFATHSATAMMPAAIAAPQNGMQAAAAAAALAAIKMLLAVL